SSLLVKVMDSAPKRFVLRQSLSPQLRVAAAEVEQIGVLRQGAVGQRRKGHNLPAGCLKQFQILRIVEAKSRIARDRHAATGGGWRVTGDGSRVVGRPATRH